MPKKKTFITFPKGILAHTILKLALLFILFLVSAVLWPLALLGLYMRSSASVNNDYGIDDYIIWELATKVWSPARVLEFLVIFVQGDNFVVLKIVILSFFFILPFVLFFYLRSKFIDFVNGL